jgi:hypothetical protein
MCPGRLPGGLPQVPFVWPGVDGFFWLRDDPVPPADVARRWLEALDKASARDGLFVLVTGLVAERRAALAQVLTRAVADPRVRVRTVGEVAAALA